MKSNSRCVAPLSLCVVLLVLGVIQVFVTKTVNGMPASYIPQGIRNVLFGLLVPLVLAMIALLGGMAHSYGILILAKIGGIAMLLVQLVSNVAVAFWMLRYYELLGMGNLAAIVANMPGIGLLNLFLMVVKNPMGIITSGILTWAHLFLALVSNLLGFAFTFSLFSVRE